MPSQVTVTAKTGPARDVTATPLVGVGSINFNLDRKVVTVDQGGSLKEFDLYGVTTVTFSITGANYTMVIS